MQFRTINTGDLETLFQTGLTGPLKRNENRLIAADEGYLAFVQQFGHHIAHFDLWGKSQIVDYLTGANAEQVRAICAAQKAGKVRNIIFMWTPGFVSLFWAPKGEKIGDNVLKNIKSLAPSDGIMLSRGECRDEVTAFLDYIHTSKAKMTMVDQIGLGLAA